MMSSPRTAILRKANVEDISNVSGEPEWLKDVRLKAFDSFQNLTWPTQQQEEWRRTSMEGLSLDAYTLARVDKTSFRTAEKGKGARITFSGRLLTQYRHDTTLVEKGGFFLRYPLAPEDESGAASVMEPVRNVLEESVKRLDSRLIAWNMSAWSEGAILYVPDGVRLDDPVVIEYANREDGGLLSIHTVVVLGREAQATVVQRFTGNCVNNALWNVGFTAAVGDGARLSIASTQQVAASHTFFQHAKVHVSRDARLDTFETVTGGELTKTRSEIFLDGPGAEATLSGVYFAARKQHIDIKTVQYHRGRHCRSRAFYKGAVADGGRSIYQGLIDVDRRAIGTDAYLTNKNLILGDGARADSIPCLEIRTNDVKCSHGSTSGRINEEELFYLMSRGIPREAAERELIVGYFEELVREAPEIEQEAIRTRILSLLE